MFDLMIFLSWFCVATIIFCPIYAIYKAKKIVNHVNDREKEFFENLKIKYKDLR